MAETLVKELIEEAQGRRQARGSPSANCGPGARSPGSPRRCW
ncbi:hypothetical protein ACFQY7_30170 [Actinomadura luteofluorescens]